MPYLNVDPSIGGGGGGGPFVPYTGAIANLNLGAFDLYANAFRGNQILNSFGQPLFDLNSFASYDGGLFVNINLGSRQLIDSTGSAVSADWGARHLVDTDGSTIVASWGGYGGYLVAPNFATDTILNTGGGAGISVVNRYLIDYSGQNSIDWQGRHLVDSYGLYPLDWGNRLLLNSSGQVVCDWNSGILSPDGIVSALVWTAYELRDSSSIASVSWSNRLTLDTSGFNSLDWQNRWAINSANATTIDWESCRLINVSDNFTALDWFLYKSYDASQSESFNWNQRTLTRSSGVMSADWENGILRDAVANTSVHYSNRQLADNGGAVVCNWASKETYDASTVRSMNWSTRTLYNASNVLAASWNSSLANFGIGIATPLAALHLKAGTASASTAPLKFTSGTLQTTAEDGTKEYNGSHYQTKSNAIRMGIGGTLARFIADEGNVTTGETDINSYTCPANLFDVDGHIINAKYAGMLVNSTSLKRLKVKFDGTPIFDSSTIATTGASSWEMTVSGIRSSSTVVRFTVKLIVSGTTTTTFVTQTNVTVTNLTAARILKLTATSSSTGAATNDIVSKMAFIEFKPNI